MNKLNNTNLSEKFKKEGLSFENINHRLNYLNPTHILEVAKVAEIINTIESSEKNSVLIYHNETSLVTSILNTYKSRYRAYIDETTQSVVSECIIIDIPFKHITLISFLQIFQECLNISKSRESTVIQFNKIKTRLLELKVKTILISNAENLFRYKSYDAQLCLKSLKNKVKCKIVLGGFNRALQYANKEPNFSVIANNLNIERDELTLLLKEYEQNLPLLSVSNLTPFEDIIFNATKGNLLMIHRLIAKASEVAILSAIEHLNKEILLNISSSNLYSVSLSFEIEKDQAIE